jgi:hypothetical protein
MSEEDTAKVREWLVLALQGDTKAAIFRRIRYAIQVIDFPPAPTEAKA